MKSLAKGGFRGAFEGIFEDVVKGVAEGIVWVVAVALVLSGCGSGGSTEEPTRGTAAAVVPASAAATAATQGVSPSASVGSGAMSSVRARSGGVLVVRAAAGDSAPTKARLAATTALGSTRVLLARRVAGDWVEVFLPIRPNGATGWVRTSDVVMRDVADRLTVDLSSRTLVLYSKGKRVLSTPVAVGAARTPTPLGTFFVTDRVRTTNPRGPYGSFALGLSAHSESLTEFGDGDAQIGIHGTNEPASIGTAGTHGCIRIPDAIARKLERISLGTPVEIVD